MSSLSQIFATALVAVVLPASPVAAATPWGNLGGAFSRLVSTLTEPGAMLVLGGLLAGLARVLARRRHEKP